VTIEAEHDGYRRLAGRPTHRRQWILSSTSLVVEDQLSGAFASAEARLHLHPDLRVTSERTGQFSLQTSEGTRIRVQFAGVKASQVRASTWHPQFGRSTPNSVLVATFAGASLVTRITWDAR
jgi:uncharacterized heparinase superfamily protein